MINLKEENALLNSTKDVYEFGVTLFKEKDIRVLLMELSEPIQFWFKNWLLIPILVIQTIAAEFTIFNLQYECTTEFESTLAVTPKQLFAFGIIVK